MTSALIAAAVALADTLERENAALHRLDFSTAATLLADKTREMAAFTEATVAGFGDAMPDAARAVAARLRAQADQNRRLLERAIAVQGRVIEAVIAAAPRSEARAAAPSGYSARGTPARGSRDAMALLARA